MHGDINPDNILMGLAQNSGTVHLIDYGMACSVVDKTTGKHIKFVNGKLPLGRMRFISVNQHNGCQTSRRDDLIALGYVMI